MNVPSHLNYIISSNFEQLHENPQHQTEFAVVCPGCI